MEGPHKKRKLSPQWCWGLKTALETQGLTVINLRDSELKFFVDVDFGSALCHIWLITVMSVCSEIEQGILCIRFDFVAFWLWLGFDWLQCWVLGIEFRSFVPFPEEPLAGISQSAVCNPLFPYPSTPPPLHTEDVSQMLQFVNISVTFVFIHIFFCIFFVSHLQVRKECWERQ